MHPTVGGRCTPLHTGDAPHPAAFYQNYRDKPKGTDNRLIVSAFLFCPEFVHSDLNSLAEGEHNREFA
jgi:hypothetical protein